jgi:Tfp pilus assembly protein PilF
VLALPFRHSLALVASLLILVSGCGRRADPPHQLTILPFEDAGGQTPASWMGRASAELLAMNLAGLTPMNILPVSDPAPANATAIAYGRYTVAAGGIALHLAVHDLRTQRRIETVSARGPNLTAAVEALARNIDPNARNAGPRNEQALRAYVEALQTSEPARAAELLDRAIEQDPDFGRAYTVALQLAMQRSDRAAAERILSAAAARGDAIGARERARLAFDAATLRGGREDRLQALISLAQLHPNDPGFQVAVAEFATQIRRYPEALAYYRRALQLRPDDPALLNSLGYSLALSGDLAAAKRELDRYRQLQPANANPLDSLGDVHYHHARFAEAAQYYLEAHGKNPSFLDSGELLKAARARLLAGENSSADQVFARYRELRKADPLLPFREAEWEFMAGRPERAREKLESFASAAEGTMAQQAFTHLAVWSLYSGQRERAQAYAQNGNELARFLAQPAASAEEWKERAERAAVEPRLRDELLAAALLFAGEFAAAEPLIQRAYQATTPFAAEGAQVLYAWALVENGRLEAAIPLIARPPIPQVTGLGPLTAIHVAKLRELRTKSL